MKVLVVEDDAATRRALERVLSEAGMTASGAATLAEARRKMADLSPDACVTDLALPDGDGLALLREACERPAHPDFLVLTGQGTIDSAVAAMKAGAIDYLVKPVRPAQLLVLLEKIAEKRSLEREVLDLRDELVRSGRLGEMIGVSPAMQEVFRSISRVARSEAPVMILGESGTGKEVAAATIHALSRRRERPFVAINCGAVTASIIESELFGHERGAFTGADRRHAGYFEAAAGGTLFLDEVTEMGSELQTKLLRVLETRTFRRVGGSEELSADVRILSSSNRDPQAAIADGRLREDLYFRLAVFPLALPPLRERREDIPALARHFLAAIEKSEKGGFRDIEAKALELLASYDWPGNVRELRNLIHRTYVLSDPPTISSEAVARTLNLALPGRGRKGPTPPRRGKPAGRKSRR